MSTNIRLPKQPAPGDIVGDNMKAETELVGGFFGLNADKSRVIWQLVDADKNVVASISFCPECAFQTASNIARAAGAAIGLAVPTVELQSRGGLH